MANGSSQRYVPAYRDTQEESMAKLNRDEKGELKVINFYEKFYRDRDAYNKEHNIKPDVPAHKSIEL